MNTCIKAGDNFTPNFRTFLRGLCLATFIAIFVVPSCKRPKKTSSVALNKDVYYTCSMHPQVQEQRPGDCPICGMKLIAVPKTNTDHATQIHLTPAQINLGNIQVDTVGKRSIGDSQILTGTLNFNEGALSTISARVAGRIEKLYFKDIGAYIHKGDKLFDLYSEPLNNAKQEYINILGQQKSMGNSLINYEALVESAKNKLLLWGMNLQQINELGNTGELSTLTSFYSSQSGHITTLSASEGEYVTEGGPVMQLANLSTLWAEAQVYTTQMTSVKKSETASVQVPDLNNEVITGTIDFVNPEINAGSRVNLIHVTIPNTNNQLHPGMPVYIMVRDKQHHSLTIPADAVLTDSRGTTVWLQKDTGIYEIRMVTTGMEENGAVEILSGLQEGDVIVTNGAYLLNSEYIFEHGTDPMAGMKM